MPHLSVAHDSGANHDSQGGGRSYFTNAQPHTSPRPGLVSTYANTIKTLGDSDNIQVIDITGLYKTMRQ